MPGTLKLNSGGAGNLILTPSGSVGSDVTVTVPAVTGTVMNSGNIPVFSAYKSANQSISHNTVTKVTFDTENYDTANCFASSTFTPNVAGYYHFTCSLPIAASANRQFSFFPSLRKNGTAIYSPEISQNISSSLDRPYVDIKIDVYANGTTDYFEVYFSSYDFTTSSSVNITGGAAQAQFSAFLTRAA